MKSLREPDTDIQLHPMTNDMVDEADRATIVPFEAMGNQVPEGVELTGTTGPITGRTPGRDDLPVQFAYALESSGGVDEQPTKTSVTLPEPAIVDAVTPLMNAADAMVVSLRLPAELAQQVAAADGVRLVQVGA